MEILYRKSKQDDYNSIKNLLETCFGDRRQCGALDNLENRYLLAFDDNKLVAMTGLILESIEFNGSEIDWTCIYPEYRGNGIITNMLENLLETTDRNVFCSCLKLYGNEKVNLYYAMNRLGFNCTLKNYKRFDSDITKACDVCNHKKLPHCVCCEDVFVRLQPLNK